MSLIKCIELIIKFKHIFYFTPNFTFLLFLAIFSFLSTLYGFQTKPKEILLKANDMINKISKSGIEDLT